MKGEVDGAGCAVEGYGADGGIWLCKVEDAAVDFHVGFGGEETAAVGVDGVGCGCFVCGEDDEIVGEGGAVVDVEEAGTAGVGGERFGWVCGGGGLVGEGVFSVRGLFRDGGWGGTPDLGRGVLGWGIEGRFGD